MNKSILAIAAVAALIATPAAATRQSVAQYLDNCKSDERDCTMIAYNLILAGQNARYLCLPKSVSLDDAATQQVAWLRQHVVDHPRFASEDLEDAQWTAAEALWPCAKG